ncbi:MAG: restriction endonuclease subunit S [Fibrobacter sp.]|nr:restriction endonuclease subunit S [Fibrobacter sp.]
MDGKQLKNSILQWAIQGKLVPQNPKDEPAQKLLEKIALSRHSERSEESSKGPKKTSTSLRGPCKGTKQSKNPPSRIYRENGVWYEQVGSATPKDISDEIPFEIPKTWTWCRLDSLGTFVRGNGIKRDETTSKGKPCVRYGEMYTTYKVKFSEVKSFTSPIVFDKCQKFHRNDILMALTGENKWDIALAAVYQGDEEVALGGDMCKFSPFECNPLYLVYLINSPYGIDYKRETSTGDIIVHTSASKLGNFLVPLPPIAEQKRIVAKLEQVLPLAEEYGAAQEQLDKLNKELPEALKKSILQEAIQGKLVPQNPKDEPASVLLAKIRKEKESLVKQGKLKKKDLECVPIDEEEIPFEIPDSWTWVRFESIAQRIVGKTPERGNSSYWSKTGYPWVTISDMSDYGHVKTTKEFISEKASNLMGTISPKDSLLMSFKLTVGRTSILDIAAYHNEAIITVLPYYDKENILRDYLFTFLPLISLTGKSKDAIKGMTLNSKSIAALLIPLPPLAEQKRIVAKLEQLLKVL